MTFIAGPYTATYTPTLGGLGALSLGIVEDGFELEEIYFGEPVRGDNMGDSTQDIVDRGKDVFVNAVFEEADKQGIQAALNMKVAASSIAQQGVVGQVGKLWTNMTGVLILTAVAGTTAATLPALFTANYAGLVNNYSVRRALASRLRKVPLRFQLLPYVISQTTYHYVMA